MIRHLEITGFKVIALMGDGVASNRKFFQMHSTSPHGMMMNPFVDIDEVDRFIYFFSDVPHLLKTARNRQMITQDGL